MLKDMLNDMLNDICITIDVDPDGLSGKSINRNAQTFDSFHKIKDDFSSILFSKIKHDIKLTWFVRIDEQIKINYGHYLYLIEDSLAFWEKTIQQNHEIAWHPHLYKIKNNTVIDILTDEIEIHDTICSLWQIINNNNIDLKTFRNGEGWMTTSLINLLEKLNIQTDSTAISGREVKDCMNKNWINTPNHFYYPNIIDCKKHGLKRSIIELPMNSWQFKTSYDSESRIRYINPAIHTHYFKQGLDYINQNWENYKNIDTWVFISHPDEIAATKNENLLYANDINVYCENLHLFQYFLQNKNIDISYNTINEATKKYR